MDKCYAEGLSEKRVQKYFTNFNTILERYAFQGFELSSADKEELERVVASIECSDYSHATKSDFKTALKRYRDHGVEKIPGEDVEYVVVDDNRKDRDRVRLPFEEVDRYDEEFYTDQLIRATESILSPLGWKRDRIRAYLRNSKTVSIQAFV